MSRNPPLKVQCSVPVRRGLEKIADANLIGRNGPSATAVAGEVAAAFSRVRPTHYHAALAALRPFQSVGKFGLIIPKPARSGPKSA